MERTFAIQLQGEAKPVMLVAHGIEIKDGCVMLVGQMQEFVAAFPFQAVKAVVDEALLIHVS